MSTTLEEEVDRLPLEHPRLLAMWEPVNLCEGNAPTFDPYDNFYAAIAVVRGALPQTYQNIVENPEGCKLAVRVINRLREAAMSQIPYGATAPNKTWDGRRA